MERYETARIELDLFDEDVIAASVEECQSVSWDDDPDSIFAWVVFYTDGTSDVFDGPDKPDICP